MVVVRLGCILSYRFLLQLQLLQMLFRCIDVCHTALRYLSIPSIYRIIISTSRAVVSCTVIVKNSPSGWGIYFTGRTDEHQSRRFTKCKFATTIKTI
jgi:hypothetical protein